MRTQYVADVTKAANDFILNQKAFYNTYETNMLKQIIYARFSK